MNKKNPLTFFSFFWVRTSIDRSSVFLCLDCLKRKPQRFHGSIFLGNSKFAAYGGVSLLIINLEVVTSWLTTLKNKQKKSTVTYQGCNSHPSTRKITLNCGTIPAKPRMWHLASAGVGATCQVMPLGRWGCLNLR